MTTGPEEQSRGLSARTIGARDDVLTVMTHGVGVVEITVLWEVVDRGLNEPIFVRAEYGEAEGPGYGATDFSARFTAVKKRCQFHPGFPSFSTAE